MSTTGDVMTSVLIHFCLPIIRHSRVRNKISLLYLHAGLRTNAITFLMDKTDL
jgi:hypothetical protein